MKNRLGKTALVTALLGTCGLGCNRAMEVGVDNLPDAAISAATPGEINEVPSNTGTGVTIQLIASDGGSTNGDDVDGGNTNSGNADSGNVNSGTPETGNAIPGAATICVGSPNGAQFNYAAGYAPTPSLLKRVNDTLAGMSLADKATQMRGTPWGSAGQLQMSDIQCTPDTSSLRGFTYRDGTRGMNLAEDMAGTQPNAGTVDGAKVGYSTVFPVSIARAAAFDLDLEYAVGEAIGDEMQAAKQTLLIGPCVDVLRHPLWGRAQETYGEDPFLIGRLGSAMTSGVQRHIAATATHVAAYGLENGRDQSDALLDEQTLREVYARHLRMVIRDAGVASVMAAYNKVDGLKSTENQHLLTDILRTDFGFRGFVVSDMWAMDNALDVSSTADVSKGLAVSGVHAGLDIELPWSFNYAAIESLVTYKAGLSMADVDASVARILEQKLRFNAQNLKGRVGLGTPVTTYKDGKISNNQDHVALAQKAALESVVLLKNDNATLPISRSVHKVAVLGAAVPFTVVTFEGNATVHTASISFATDVNTGDRGSSRAFFDPSLGVGPFDGIRHAAPPGVTVVTGTNADAAADADFVVVVTGLTPGDEGEEFTMAGDRTSLALDAKQSDPAKASAQNDLIAAAVALGKPMVVVLEGSNAIDLPWLAKVPAVVMAFYPGMVGGEALGHLLWGDASFSGKLPFTWPNQLSDLPAQRISPNQSMLDYYVGYRYFDRNAIAPLFPFGHGLSYTNFAYRRIELPCGSVKADSAFPVRVTVANTGTVEADETVMLFVSYPNTHARRPLKELKGFARVHAKPGEEVTTTIYVRASDLDYWRGDASGSWVIETDQVRVLAGPNAGHLPLSGTISVVN